METNDINLDYEDKSKDIIMRTLCSTCLSYDRTVYSINTDKNVASVFLFLVSNGINPILEENINQLICWECLALMKRIIKFKSQAMNAQEHLALLSLNKSLDSTFSILDHSFLPQPLSQLSKNDIILNQVYIDASIPEWSNDTDSEMAMDDGKTQSEYSELSNVAIDSFVQGQDLSSPVCIQETTMNLPHLMVSQNDPLTIQSDPLAGSLAPSVDSHNVTLTISPITQDKDTVVIKNENQKDNLKACYTTEYMTDEQMAETREESKKKLMYVNSMYKCELCILAFYTQKQLEDHFVSNHRARANTTPCPVCFSYVDETKLVGHIEKHYLRHMCNLCSHTDVSSPMMTIHVKAHMVNVQCVVMDKKACVQSNKNEKDVKPGNLRKLLAKTVIEGYQCLECDMFFKTARARKTHVDRCHREGYECDHCKKKFVNKSTLATHMRLHNGPQPRSECPVCHKMVRDVQLKYHIQRHENKLKYTCEPCQKTFSHLTTYQAHLKYSRAHADTDVFKFPCPVCSKRFPNHQWMQDHFNYQHLGKTTHKCPICDKPISSKSNVEKHIRRVHTEKKDMPRNHPCPQCGKAFLEKKSLMQHLAIHSGDRPLACDLCAQTFRQKASLYTHKKRIHKVQPPKKNIEYLETKPNI